MRILGIDPGMGVTGFAVLDEGEDGILSFVCADEVRTRPNHPFPERLKAVFDRLLAVIDGRRPESVALEDTFMAKNVKSALKLGQARGVALLAAGMRNLPVFEYAPTAVKTAVVGYGGATKHQVAVMVSRLLRLSDLLPSEHQADAAAAAICHAHASRLQRRIGGVAPPGDAGTPYRRRGR